MSGSVEIGHCGRCRFASAGNYVNWPDWRLDFSMLSADIHCGHFDRRVTPVAGCSKFDRAGGQFHPHPLEH